MDWRTFLIGVLVGWLIEWIIDYLYWRKRPEEPAASGGGLAADLKVARADLDKLRAQLAGSQSQLEACSAESQGLKAQVESLQVDLTAAAAAAESAKAEREALGARLAESQEALEDRRQATRTAAAAAAVAGAVATRAGGGEAVIGDDLTRIWGIGPEIALVLEDDGIVTYDHLASAEPAALKRLLVAGGPQFNTADPTTWPEQARLAAAGSWAALWALQDRLATEAKHEHDDLTRIEGVGDRVEALLKAAEIKTYAALRDTDPDRLVVILRQGGPDFNLVDPRTWPEQAALAAAGDWDGLAVYQARLVGGREPDDNLEVIEGIGPAISQLLHQHGIRTFKVLAMTEEAVLHAILVSGGSRFQLADPETWPEQAALAAAGKWDALEALQERLNAGRREP